MTPAARALYERGLSRYADHDFEGAVRDFEAGFAVEPRREFLFAEAQAHRLRGDCARAISCYERFLATHPPAIQIEATELGLQRCRAPAAGGTTSATRAAATATAATAATTAVTPAPPAESSRASGSPGPQPVRDPTSAQGYQPAPPPRPWWRDAWTTGTFAAGLLGLGTGVAFWVAGDEARARAESDRTRSYDDFASGWQRFEQRREIAVGTLSAGAVLVLLGAGRAAWLAEHGAVAAPRATLGFDGHRLMWSAAY
jgi:tetratricopeptide (TPR) repeat protein